MFFKRYLSRLVTLAFLAIFAWYGLTHKDLFEALKYVSIATIILVAVGKMAMNVVTGLFTQWTAEVFTRKFTFGESIYITILSSIGNFFGPLLGGTSIRAVYFKKVHKLPYSKFTSTLLGYYLLLFTVNCSLAIVSVLLLKHTRQTKTLLLFFGLWLLVLIVLMFLRLPKRERLARFEKGRFGRFVVKTLYEVESGWHLIFSRKKLLTKLIGLAFLSFFVTFATSWVEFNAVHVSISVPALGLYTAFVVVSMLVSLTPAAIGIRESMLFIISSTLGVSNAAILQVAVIDRGVNFLLLFVLFLATRNKRAKKFFAADESFV